jgi:Super-infection exclusion protein B
MMPDPRWLEILKASGWQMAAIAAACGLFLLVVHWGWVPPLDAWVIQLVTFAFLLFGLLAIAGLISATLAVFPLHKWVRHWIDIRREKGSVRDYIPHMTEREREIIAYLLNKNEKTFTAESDGGYAATLVSRGIVRIPTCGGQRIDPLDVPMIIPDHVWAVLIQHKEQFPYRARMKGSVEIRPWRKRFLQ